MTDRERLIELICDKLQDNDCIAHCNHPPCSQCKGIADHLLANGVGVMPCKVGDSVYCIDNKEHIVKTYIVTCMRFEWFESCTNFILTTSENDKLKFADYWEFSSYHIGKTVFLTKELAEKALAERIGDNVDF